MKRNRTLYGVLVVEDFEPWRRYLCSTIERTARWRVVGEASDGPAAVRATMALSPDLILLDVGLPSMNGLEVARRILTDRPDARILFVSDERSPDVAEAALGLGAAGYLFKVDAGVRLVPAMEAAVGGGRCVSASLVGHRTDLTRRPMLATANRHVAGFHSREEALLDTYAQFANAVLEAGDTFVFVADASRRRMLRERLETGGLARDRAPIDGRFQTLDLRTALDRVLVDGWPNEVNFRATAAGLVAAADTASPSNHARVALSGECAGELWKQGRRDAAVRLEQLWEEFSAETGVAILCGYPLERTGLDEDASRAFQHICTQHTSVSIV